MRQLLSIFFLLSLGLLPLSVNATHIVGGELTYKCLGNNQYELKLTVFRDCFNGIPWFDNPAAIGIFSNTTNILLQNILVPLDPMLNDTLDPTLEGDCLVVPPNVCVNTTTYSTVVTLPFLPGGYNIAYQRCCRNNTIANLILPEDVGATFNVVLTEKAMQECNSSPVFKEFPPLFFCVGLTFNIDQSAIDIDGDSLVYKLCNPFTGANDLFPMPQPPNPPPYFSVPWLPPYGVNNQINLPPAPPMSIDLHTGMLSGTPNLIGQFAIGYCVEEYRNGELISVNRRDYQVNVGDCQTIISSFFAPEVICDSYTVSFDNQSLEADQFLWFFNDPNNPGFTSTEVNPIYTYSDTGLYEVTLIAQPGAICADTFTAQVYIQPQSLFPDFEVEVTPCSETVLIEVNDLTVDTFSTVVAWDWMLISPFVILTSFDQNPVFEVMPPGPASLKLTVTAANGCTATIEKNVPLKVDLLNLDLGPDINDCTLPALELNAGSGFVSYLWNDNSTGQSLTVTTTGSYAVTATDACGNTQTDEVFAMLGGPDLDLGPDLEICEGGSYTFSVEGFDAYEWSPADYLSCTDCPNPTTTPESSVTYILIAATNDGCISSDTIHITLLPGYETFEELEICNGDTATIFGNPVTTQGSYTETFTSQDGCDSTHTVNLTVLMTFESIEDAMLCQGDTLTVFGMPVFEAGVFSEVFTATNGCDSIHTISVGLLFPSFTTEQISICFGETADVFGTPIGVSGVYEMTFTAFNGCDSTHTIALEVNDEIQLDLVSSDVSCFGNADGSASVTATGGTGNFSYNWSTGDTTASVTGLAAGTYSVVVSDDSGCTAEGMLTIQEPAEILVTVSGVDVTCDEPGSASVTATGGVGDFTYAWNTGEVTPGITGLVAGTYAVVVTDENGCTGEGAVTITGALGPQISIQVDQALTEDEPDMGILSVQINGGAGPFQIEWSNGEGEETIDSLGSGLYIVTVTDDNGCIDVDSAYLYIPACTGGKIWNDIDRDGCQEGGEIGMEGVELHLSGTDIWGNAITGVTYSIYNGEYIFENLPPGVYQVTMNIPSGYLLTTPNHCADDFTDSDFALNGVGLDIISLVEGHCCLIIDGGLYDACLNVTHPGAICCDQVLCGPGNDPDPITVAMPATGAPPSQIEYMWIYSHEPPAGSWANGAWYPVLDAQGNPVMTAQYDPGPLSQTTYFARCVRRVGCEKWLETNKVKITIDDKAVAAIDNPGPICVDDAITFTAAQNLSGAKYKWDFGPAATPAKSSKKSPVVTFNSPGYYEISLTVTRAGCTSVDILEVAVSNSPVYCGTAQPGTGNDPFSVRAADLMEGGASFTVFPNPVNDNLTVRWVPEQEGTVQIEILTVEGKLLQRDLRESQAGEFTTDLSDFRQGMYLIKMQDHAGNCQVTKIVKH